MLTERVYDIALTNPGVFRRLVRPLLYRRCGGDAERVHDMSVGLLREYESALERITSKFDFGELHLQVLGRSRMPFGTAAGFDKDGEALYPLSLIFGFEEPGTVVLKPREGNPRPRVAADGERREVYNAQGFPSRGAGHFARNAREYRERGGKAPLLVSICGIPPSPSEMEAAYSEMESLVDMIGPYADGFVWNPYSPNTAALQLLRTSQCFRRTAELLKGRAGGKLRLVKMGPYDDGAESRSDWITLLRSWIEGGGDGIVATNAYPVPREQVPSPRWGYAWAGRSGRFLRRYRDRAVSDAKRMFPHSVVVATGGIDSGAEALKAFEAGADMLEGYSPYTFEGFGLLPKISKELVRLLNQKGYSSLAEFIERRDRKIN